jgi:hypothetical protein
MGATAYGAFYIYTGTDKTNNMTLTPSGRIEVALTPILPQKKQQPNQRVFRYWRDAKSPNSAL